MKSMRIAANLAVAMAAVLVGLAPRGPSKASGAELASAVGGGCYYCMPGEHCSNNTCDAVGAYWSKMVGTGMTPMYCASVAAGNQGMDQCTVSAPTNCVNTYTCTDKACTNCGYPATETKDNSCSTSGYQCTG